MKIYREQKSPAGYYYLVGDSGAYTLTSVNLSSWSHWRSAERLQKSLANPRANGWHEVKAGSKEWQDVIAKWLQSREVK